MANRDNIYYWKCDRPQAFFAIDKSSNTDSKSMESEVRRMMTDYLRTGDFTLNSAAGEGNHLTFLARQSEQEYFIRLENGPEADEYMEVEAEIVDQVRRQGVPTPKIFRVDSSRTHYPFAYQIMERLTYKDLNRLDKQGQLDTQLIMYQLGEYIAQWQNITPEGFGPFAIDTLRNTGILRGLHRNYAEYYLLNLDKHLDFLLSRKFLKPTMIADIKHAVSNRAALLEIGQGCLVHKDIALWNLLGDESHIRSVIDWDDAVCGDPTDDLSLMGCYNNGRQMEALIAGYESRKELPSDFETRLWLHLLRNMLFKAVIRVGAGYFDRDGSFFLIGSDSDGETFHNFTLNRIENAYLGLCGRKHIDDLK